ncbi:MAG: hypothetical protein ACHP84_18895 [Caulobacterales bacterium]
MGSRNLDRIAMWQWRARCETVAAMQRERWRVVAWCEVCRSAFAVDLAKVARLKGPESSLWNRRQPCLRQDCAGQMRFEATIPGLYGRRVLDAPHPATVPPRPTLGEMAARNRQKPD